MPDRLRVLVVGGDPGLAEDARRCVSESRAPVVVQWLQDAAVALARLGGGDIDALVIDPASMGAGGDRLEGLLERLRAACRRTQAIVVSESRDWTADLRRALATSLRNADSSGPRKPKLIGFLGAKGGVGATTVALNTAFALAEKHATILAELGSGNDTLKLRVRTTAKSLYPPGAALSCLWSVKDIPRLQVALAQDIVAPEEVAGELEAMGAEAEYVVLDLGSTLTSFVKTALPRLNALGVVVDMEMLSVECARRVLSAIGQPDLGLRGAIGVVAVNRASLACPISVDEVQRLVGMPVLGSIPSAADLSSAAQKARRPVISFDPESLAAQSLAQVAFSFAEMA
jgi:pilus assembly protein CpaE